MAACSCHALAVLALVICLPVAIAGASPPRSGDDEEAAKYFDAFLQNFRQVATCEIEVTGYGSRHDRSVATDYYRLLKRDEAIRLDHLHRRLGPSGVEMETLSRKFFDGERTIRVDISFPGIKREYGLGNAKGIRASIVERCDLPFTQSLMDCLSFWTISVGDILTFDRTWEMASEVQMIDPIGPTIRLVLPDLERSSGVVSQRQVDFVLDRRHGFWPKEVRCSSRSDQNGQIVQYRGRTLIERFLDLGRGRFFPERIDVSTLDEAGHSHQHPVHVVTKCRINESITENAIELQLPQAAPILVQPVQVGQVVKHSALVHGAGGKTKRFSQQTELEAFAATVKGSPDWTATYVPPAGLPYYYKTVDDVRTGKLAMEDPRSERKIPRPPAPAQRSMKTFGWMGAAVVVVLLVVVAGAIVVRIRGSRH